MAVAPIYREIAGGLRDEIFHLRWEGKLGDTEESIPTEMLKELLAAKMADLGQWISDAELTLLARSFPPIDLTPDDAASPEADLTDHEVDSIAKLLSLSFPGLADRIR